MSTYTNPIPNSTGGALGLGYGLVLITWSGATYGGGTIHGITIPPAHINGCGDPIYGCTLRSRIEDGRILRARHLGETGITIR